MPVVAPRTAASRSASAKTMFGDLPPSSSVTLLQRLGGAAHDAACRSRSSPVNAILSTPGMLDDAPGRPSSPAPVTTLSTPGGRPTSCAISAERERGQRRLARRLDDDGVAARQRRRDLPRRQQQREVPRHDRGDDADRLAQRVGEVVALDRDRLAVDLVGPAGEVLEALGGRRHVDRAATRRSACRCAASRAARSRRPSPSAARRASRPAGRARAPTASPHGPSKRRARRRHRARRRRSARPTRPRRSPLRSPG